MSIRTVIQSGLRHIEEISNREFRFAVFVCLVIAALNALVIAYSIGYDNGHVVCGYPYYFPGRRDYSYDFIRLKIEAALLIIFIALGFKRVVGFSVSVLATVFIEIQYALWYFDTQRWLREMGATHFSELPIPSEWPNFAGLYRATPWDFVVLVFITALLAWQFRVLIALVTSSRQKNTEDQA